MGVATQTGCWAQTLPNTSPEDLFDQAAPAVVLVTTQMPDQATSQGSGFIVRPDGLIVTACHVLFGATEASIRLKDGRQFVIQEITAFNTSADICAIRIEASSLPTIPLGNSNELTVGQRVFVIGHPLGLEYSIADGLISGMRNEMNRQRIQFSAPVSPGSSGCPVLDSQGRAVGVFSYFLEGAQQLNFAAAINGAKKLMETPTPMTLAAFGNEIGPAFPLVYAGARALAEGNRAEAVRQLQEAVETDPTFADAYSLLTFAYSIGSPNLDELDQGIRYGEQAIRLGSADHLWIGTLYGRRAIADEGPPRVQDVAKAKEYLNQALQLKQLDPAQVYERLGWVSGIEGDFEKAEAHYQESIRLNPNLAAAYDGLGLVYYNQGQLDQAIESYRHALELEPQLASAHVGLCATYIMKGDKRSALAQFAAFKAVHPPSWQIVFVERMLNERFGSTDQELGIRGVEYSFPTEADQRVLAKLNPEARRYFEASLGEFERGNARSAARHLGSAMTLVDSDSPEFEVLRKFHIVSVQQDGINLHDTGQFNAARAAYEEAIALIGSSTDPFLRPKLAECRDRLEELRQEMSR